MVRFAIWNSLQRPCGADSCAVYQHRAGQYHGSGSSAGVACRTNIREPAIAPGIFTACLWLTWTCAQLNRPLLGISTYALVWYLESFSDLPQGSI